jgi:hypothetical protein
MMSIAKAPDATLELGLGRSLHQARGDVAEGGGMSGGDDERDGRPTHD